MIRVWRILRDYRYGWLVLQVALFVAIDVYAKTDPGLIFIENKNQWPAPVNFSARIPDGDMFLQPGRFDYYFVDGQKLQTLHQQSHGDNNEAGYGTQLDFDIDAHYLQVNFLGANLQSKPQPVGLLPAYYNYFIGKDSSHWASRAKSYSGVYYEDFYSGINMHIYSEGINIKYDYIVKPGINPSVISVQVNGANRLFLNDGNLEIRTALVNLVERKPYAFQFIDGKRREVKCHYILKKNIISFAFPEGYDSCYELVIDPLLVFSTYSGSTADNWGSTATPGERGCLYSAGVTTVSNIRERFPSTPGAFQTAFAGAYDIGILKYDSTGQHLLFASYLGGSESESPHSLVMSANEELIVLGTTSSVDFPVTTQALGKTFKGGTKVSHVVTYENGSDIFVTRISKDGSKLLGSTYLGGSRNDGLNVVNQGLVRNYGDQLRGDIITDAAGDIYISSVTSSPDFPMRKGVDTTFNGGSTDALLIKLKGDLSAILWDTFIGGARTDAAHTLKLDPLGNIFLAGGTNSLDFPTTPGSYQPAIAGQEDGWIACVKNSGDAILFATHTGTSSYDQIYFLDLNEKSEVFVYGQTEGTFPISTGVYNNPRSGQFVQKFDSTLTSLKFSTVFGSGRQIPDISPTAFLVNECNNLFMAGWGGVVNSNEGFWASDTQGMPTTKDAYQKTTSGSDFYFMVLTSDASEFLYGTYLGGTQSRTHVDGGTSRFDKSGIVYHAVCSGCAAFNATNHSTSDFPTTASAWSRKNNSPNCNNAAFKFDLALLKSRILILGPEQICIPDKATFHNKSVGGQQFEWDFGDGTTAIKYDTSVVAHLYKNAGQYTVKLRAIDDRTCTGIDSAHTSVYVFKGQSSVQPNDALCFGDAYQLKAGGGVSYAWKSSDGSFTSAEAQPTVNPQDTTRYLLTVTEASGCIRQDTVQLSVVPGIDIEFDINRVSNCLSRPFVEVVNNSPEMKSTDQLFFDFGDGQTSDNQVSEHRYEKDAVYHVKLVAVREFCAFEKSEDVSIFSLKIPNVITPGDGSINNKFVIQYGDQDAKKISDDESNVTTPENYGLKVSVVVYDRWGKLTYSSTDYKSDWSGDGLASGVYYYEVTVAGHATCKDWLHIVK